METKQLKKTPKNSHSNIKKKMISDKARAARCVSDQQMTGVLIDMRIYIMLHNW